MRREDKIKAEKGELYVNHTKINRDLERNKIAEEQEKKLKEQQETNELIDDVKQNDKAGYLIYKELELISKQNDIIITLLQQANSIKSSYKVSNSVPKTYDASDYLRDSLIVERAGRKTVEGEAAYRRLRDYEHQN